MVNVRVEGSRFGIYICHLLTWTRTIGVNVKAKGHSQVLGRSPQGFVLRLIVAPFLRRIDGDHSSHIAHLGATLQLLYTLLHIIHVDHCDTLEPIRNRATEFANPIVVGPEDGG